MTPDARLNADLGITGYEAAELLASYSERFSVDLSEFRFLDHFEREGPYYWRGLHLAIAPVILPNVRRRPRLAQARESDITVEHITVEHLVDCARTGRWRPPIGISFRRKSSLPALLSLMLFHTLRISIPIMAIVLIAAGINILSSASGFSGDFKSLGICGMCVGAGLAVLALDARASWRWYRSKTCGTRPDASKSSA